MKLIRQILLLTLTLLVLVSSTGFTMGVHFCAGELNDLSFYGKATHCLMEQKEDKLPPCHAPKKDASSEKSCCEDHQLVVERMDLASESKAFVPSKVVDIQFLAVVKAVILQLFAPTTKQNSAYALYTSPPVVRDIPILVQSFLI